MFINNWYAACSSEALGAEPRQVRMLGCDFVLFRDADGVARCLGDVCVHRGASLAGGRCSAGTLSCPQHGWHFDGTGRCTLIPAGTRTPRSPPPRARVPAYPVEERFGLVFAWLGDAPEAERPALPDFIPEYAGGDWHHGVIERSKALNYLRLAENYNDPCHVHYVHDFAKWLPKGVTIIDQEVTDDYLRAFHASWDAHGQFSEHAGLLMEYWTAAITSRNTNYQPGYPPQIVVACLTPVDEFETRIHMILMMPGHETRGRDGAAIRGATAEEHRMLVDMTRDTVMDEDYAVLKTTRPRLAASPAEELIVETDRTLVQVRQMTLARAARGGEIDSAAAAGLRDRHVLVIPCPGHRDEPRQWVHRTVPLRGQEMGPADTRAAR